MHKWRSALLVTAIATVGCQHASKVQDDVRAFMLTVAHDITQEGPAAWRRHFADSPYFFMAVDGHMAFPNSAAVTAAIPDLVRAIPQIKLQWGNDLRVDPLTPDLAVVATTYRETQVGPNGKSVDDNGFFTGTTERRNGRWQFRNAHWSSAVPIAPH
jgi:hypothetical protein